jgi:hypothetical protein
MIQWLTWEKYKLQDANLTHKFVEASLPARHAPRRVGWRRMKFTGDVIVNAILD